MHVTQAWEKLGDAFHAQELQQCNRWSVLKHKCSSPKECSITSPCTVTRRSMNCIWWLRQYSKVLLCEWWLRRSGKRYNGRSLAVGGYTKRGDAVIIFNSAPIVKRHDPMTLVTLDGITLRIQGPFNQKCSLDNGFPIEDAKTFSFGFPSTWDNFDDKLSGNKPSCQQLLETERETISESSFEQKTVLLRDWWLRRTEKAYEGSKLGIGGFTDWGKARRIFNSSPIIRRHDAYTLETADSIIIRIQGFINKTRTLDNGFPLKACRNFFVGFPTTWADFVNESSENNPPHAETPLSASRYPKWSNDTLPNRAFGSPSPYKNRIFGDDAPLISNTCFRDSTSRLQEIIKKLTTQGSVSDTEHMPSIERVFNYLTKKSLCENDRLQVAESSETIMRYACTVDNDSEHHEVGRTEGAECRTCDLHADGVLQNHGKLCFAQDATFSSVMKESGCAITKDHHGGGSGTCSTGDSRNSVGGKDVDKVEAVYEKVEKYGKSSGRTSIKARSGSSKLGYLHGVDLKVTESSPQRVVNSSPIIICHDACTLVTADGITQGFINKTRTLDNGFPLKACRNFLVHFPTTWADFVNESSENNPLHAETPLSVSRYPKWSNDTLPNMAFGSPSPHENKIFDDNAPSTSNTIFRDSTSRFQEIIPKLRTQGSVSDTEHMPSIERVLNHSTEKSSCENDQLQVAESSETIMRCSCAVDNDSEHHEVGRPEGAECRTCDLHAGVLQNHGKLCFAPDATFSSVEKESGCAITKDHHGGRSGTCSTGDSRNSVVGNDVYKAEAVYEKVEKCGKSSARTSIKARSGSSKFGYLHGEDLEVTESSPQPTRRSNRLMLLKLLNVQGEYREISQFPNKSNDLDHANWTLDASNSSRTSQVNGTVAKGSPLSATSAIPLPSPGMFSVENGDAHQHSRKSGLVVPSKSYSAKFGCDCASASTALWQNSNDNFFFSSDHMAGVVKGESRTNSKAATSKALERMMTKQEGKKKDSETVKRKRKDNQKAYSRKKVEHNGFRNQLYSPRSEENISFKSSTPTSGRKANMKSNLGDAKKIEGAIDMQQTEDKAYCTTGFRTTWASCYKAVQVTRNMGERLSICTPESLNLKRSRSGRVLIPPLDCSTKILYGADGSVIGTTAVATSISPFDGSGKKSDSRMRKRQR